MVVLTSANISAQEYTQVVRGRVVDAETRVPLSFTTVSIQTTKKPMGTTTDLEGMFCLEDVPVGWHDIHVSYSGNQSLSLAYRKHSRLEPLSIYFALVPDGLSTAQPNKQLDITKAHHLVLAYDLSLSQYLRLKVEPYFQYLYDVPVIPDFNTNYVFNLLFGKEWVLGKGKNKILGINGRLNVLGGQRITPINRSLSIENKEIRYDYSR